MKNPFSPRGSKALAAALVTVLFSSAASPAHALEDSKLKHLDYDVTDKVWRCIGTPVNCDFDQ